MADVVLYGATGYTGRLVAAELRRRGVTPCLAGRRRAALEELARAWNPPAPVAVAEPQHPHALAAMLRGALVLINTVGPFTELGPPVVAAAVAAGVHYLDTTGEQGFMAWCRAEVQDRAVARRLAVINAAAFEFGPGTLGAARLLTELGPVARLDIGYLGGSGTSRGTRKSVLRVAARGGLGFEDGRFVSRTLLSQTRWFVVPQGERRVLAGWIPGGEILAAPRLGRVTTVRTFMAVEGSAVQAIRLLGPLLPLLSVRPIRALVDRVLERGSVGPDEAVGQPMLIVIETMQPESRLELVVPRPYGITAVISVEAALGLLAAPPRIPGVVSLPEAFDGARFLDVLAPHGVEVRRAS